MPWEWREQQAQVSRPLAAPALLLRQAQRRPGAASTRWRTWRPVLLRKGGALNRGVGAAVLTSGWHVPGAGQLRVGPGQRDVIVCGAYGGFSSGNKFPEGCHMTSSRCSEGFGITQGRFLGFSAGAVQRQPRRWGCALSASASCGRAGRSLRRVTGSGPWTRQGPGAGGTDCREERGNQNRTGHLPGRMDVPGGTLLRREPCLIRGLSPLGVPSAAYSGSALSDHLTVAWGNAFHCGMWRTLPRGADRMGSCPASGSVVIISSSHWPPSSPTGSPRPFVSLHLVGSLCLGARPPCCALPSTWQRCLLWGPRWPFLGSPGHRLPLVVWAIVLTWDPTCVQEKGRLGPGLFWRLCCSPCLSIHYSWPCSCQSALRRAGQEPGSPLRLASLPRPHERNQRPSARPFPVRRG